MTCKCCYSSTWRRKGLPLSLGILACLVVIRASTSFSVDGRRTVTASSSTQQASGPGKVEAGYQDPSNTEKPEPMLHDMKETLSCGVGHIHNTSVCEQVSAQETFATNNASSSNSTTKGPTKHGRQCRADSCQTVASYGNPVTRTKEFCKKHRGEGDLLLTGRKCEAEKCRKQASFDAPGGVGRRCSTHKLPDHVAVSNRCRGAPGCARTATFGHEQNGVTRAQRCSLHAGASDFRLSKKVRPTCKHEGCMLVPSFGFSKGNPLFCKSHAQEGCFNAKGHRRCSYGEGCNKIASFGDANTRRKGELFCVEVGTGYSLCACVYVVYAHQAMHLQFTNQIFACIQTAQAA
jgi:hypothetical protein